MKQEKRGRRGKGSDERHRSARSPTTTTDDRSCLNHVPVIPLPPPAGAASSQCWVVDTWAPKVGGAARNLRFTLFSVSLSPPSLCRFFVGLCSPSRSVSFSSIYASSLSLSATLHPPRKSPYPSFSRFSLHHSPSSTVLSYMLLLFSPSRFLLLSLSSFSTRSLPLRVSSPRHLLAFSVPFFFLLP